jgi:hypothetical protein
MSKRKHSRSRAAAAVLAGATLLLPFVAQTASADPPPWARAYGRGGHGHYAYAPTRGYGYVVVHRTNTVVVRPVFPEAFVVRRPRFVVAQPVPVWAAPYHSVSGAIGIHTRGLNLDFSFSKQHPYYGCSFCGDYFSSYDAWARHEQSCPDRPAGRVLCQPWDEDELRACQDQAGQAYRDPQAYDREDEGNGYDNGNGYGEDQGDQGSQGNYYRHGDPSYRGGDDDR